MSHERTHKQQCQYNKIMTMMVRIMDSKQRTRISNPFSICAVPSIRWFPFSQPSRSRSVLRWRPAFPGLKIFQVYFAELENKFKSCCSR